MRLLPNRYEGWTSKEVQNRMLHLEGKIEEVQRKLQRLSDENKKMKQDLKFFEMLLLEEYHLLLQLLGKDQGGYWMKIHCISNQSVK